MAEEPISKAELDRRMEVPPSMTPEQHAAAASAASKIWGYQIDVVSSIPSPPADRGGSTA